MQVLSLFILALGLFLEPACAPVRVPDSQAQQQQQQEQEKKKEQKKNEPAPGPGDSPEAAARERRAISRVLRDFGDGFEGKSPRRVTENLDERFDDFPRFEDLVTQFLEQSGEMRLFLRESSAEVKGDSGALTVDAEMIFSRKSDGKERRRKARVQFDFTRTEKGWKILEIHPRGFFTP